MAYNGARTDWDNTFETNEPVNTDTVAEGDDHIRQLKVFVRDRAETEHHWSLASSAADTGRHRAGSAVAFYGNADPATLTVTDADSSNAFGAGDAGRLLGRSDTGQLKIHNGTTWVEAVTALAGSPANRVDLLSGVQFLKAAADSMDIHDHDARHQLSGVEGAETMPADIVKYLIRRIKTTTNLVSGAAPTQAAGTSPKMAISLDTTGRTTTSHALLIAIVNFQASGASVQTGAVKSRLDGTNWGTGAQSALAPVAYACAEGAVNSDSAILIDYYKTISAAAHTFNVFAFDINNTPDYQSGYTILIDLGME